MKKQEKNIHSFSHIAYHIGNNRKPIKNNSSMEIKVNGILDKEATNTLSRIIDGFSSSGSINFEMMNYRMEIIDNKITGKQREEIYSSAIKYVYKNLFRGQTGNINGFDTFLIKNNVDSISLELTPDQASTLRFYNEFITHDFFAFDTSNSIGRDNKLRENSLTYNVDLVDKKKDEELKKNLKYRIQYDFPMINVTDKVLDEIILNKSILHFLNLRNDYRLQESASTDNTVRIILSILEYNLDSKMTQMRETIRLERGGKLHSSLTRIGHNISKCIEYNREDEKIDQNKSAYVLLFPDLLEKTTIETKDKEYYDFVIFNIRKDIQKHIEGGKKLYILPYYGDKELQESSNNQYSEFYKDGEIIYHKRDNQEEYSINTFLDLKFRLMSQRLRNIHISGVNTKDYRFKIHDVLGKIEYDKCSKICEEMRLEIKLDVQGDIKTLTYFDILSYMDSFNRSGKIENRFLLEYAPTTKQKPSL